MIEFDFENEKVHYIIIFFVVCQKTKSQYLKPTLILIKIRDIKCTTESSVLPLDFMYLDRPTVILP